MYGRRVLGFIRKGVYILIQNGVKGDKMGRLGRGTVMQGLKRVLFLAYPRLSTTQNHVTQDPHRFRRLKYVSLKLKKLLKRNCAEG